MSDEIKALRDLVHERTGLFFRDFDGLEVLENSLRHRLEKTGCKTFTEYTRQLSRNDENSAGEWRGLMSILTKPASSFFRHTPYTRILTENIVPQLLAAKPEKQIKIWSAACSTGEEPVSIAMALTEANLFERAEIKIHASDGNPVSVEKARRGTFSDIRTGQIPPELRSKYFVSAGEDWHADAKLLSRIEFSVANLMNENDIALFADADVIFCRNVFIYFSESSILKTLNMFAKHMPAGGILFADEGEYFTSVVKQTEAFEELTVGRIQIWKKRR